MKSHKALSLTNKVMFNLKILFCDREKKKKSKAGARDGEYNTANWPGAYSNPCRCSLRYMGHVLEGRPDDDSLTKHYCITAQTGAERQR